MDKFNNAAIIILTYNNLEYNKNCIESIRKYTETGTYELIVVDNNSTDGTREWLKTQPDLKLILNESNVGFPKGCNMGIALAAEDSDILLLNNDTVVTQNWLENLRICLYSKENIGAAGAVSNHNENLQGADFSYDTLPEMEILAKANNLSDSKRWEEKIFLIGFCLLIKRTAFNKIGNLAEEYSPGYVEDNDLSLRILTAGYKLMLCHDCFIHHYLGSEFRKDLSTFYPLLMRNREIFKSKWGFETYLFDDVDFASLKILDEPDKNKEMRVLEANCKLGLNLLKIKYDYPNALLCGIEPNKSTAAISGRIAQVSAKLADSFPLDFPENYFDYILIGNLLETTENPERLLTEIKKHLKENGCVLCTIQNMMHYSVIRSLLQGDWFYARDKVPKQSNTSYFTFNDIMNLFSRCGFKSPHVFHWYSTPTEDESGFIRKICDLAQEKRPYLYYTYLFSVKCQK
jgi:Predicted glycosyltransferases